MTRQCDSCMHKNVCTYSECYEKAMSAVEEAGWIESYPFSCKIECDYYKEELTARAVRTPSTPSFVI